MSLPMQDLGDKVSSRLQNVLLIKVVDCQRDVMLDLCPEVNPGLNELRDRISCRSCLFRCLNRVSDDFSSTCL